MKLKNFSSKTGDSEIEITENLAYVTGFILGDGNLGNGYLVRAVEENEAFLNKFSEIFESIFKRKPKIYFDKFNRSYVAYVHSKKIWQFLSDFGINT